MSVSRRTLLLAGSVAPFLALTDAPLLAATRRGFTHSVASGDPHQDRVVLWTRYVDGTNATELRFEVARDEGFRDVVARGVTVAGPMTDFCAHARVERLASGQRYHYRFVAPNGERSPAGRTCTLPEGPVESYRIAVLSCANATSGWFNAYRHAAERDDIDLVVHLGDYIYESPVDRSDALAGLAEARGIAPHDEAVSLADYRLRHASYRADPDLMELHRRHPMIIGWDDHESANNSWKDGASNHDAGEGPWPVRKAAATRAFAEWLPVDGRPYADHRIGDLATLFRPETRLLHRSRQLDFEDFLGTRTDFGAAVREFRAGPLADPNRTIMGRAQEAWLSDGLAASVAAGTRWQILAQQVILSPTRLPEISADWFGPDRARDEVEAAVARSRQMARFDIPFGLDRWEGYPAARERLLTVARRADADLVVLSGDSHNGWAYDVTHEGQPVGVEFAGQSVSSFGIDKRFSGAPERIAADFVAANSNMAWCDTSRRGYMAMTVTPNEIVNEWLFLPSRRERSTRLLGTHRMVVQRGSRRLSPA